MVSEFIGKLILPVPGALIVWIKMETRSCQTKPVVPEHLLMRRNEILVSLNSVKKTPFELNREWVGG